MKNSTDRKGSAWKILSFPDAYPRISFIMKVSLLYLILICTSLQLIAENLSGQDLDAIKVTAELSDAPVSALVKQITEQTKLSFAYAENIERIKLNLRKGTRSVRATLDEAFSGSGLGWELKGNTILVVVPAEVPAVTPAVVPVPEPLSKTPNPAFRVNGTIKSTTGEAIPGVNVVVKETTRGTTSDADGRYSIEVDNSDAVLVFSFIGFKTFEASVSNRTTVDVTMEDDLATLASVEVVGTNYFSTEKEYSTMNISKVEAKDIEKQPVTSPLMSLQGRMAGVDVSPVGNNGPGGAIKILIRGQNSLRTGGAQGDGNLPLYVIDGIPIDPRPLQSGSSSVYQNGFDPLSAINPTNIESIQVLKDAAATAIYGSRGSNGVVLITTKKGGKSGGTNIDVSAYTGIAQIVPRVKLLNRNEYMEMRHEALNNDGVEPSSIDHDLNGTWDTTRTTNWQKELLGHTGRVYDAQVNLSGGGANTSFLVGGGFHKETSPVHSGFGFQRMNTQLSINHTSSNNKLKGFASINYGNTKSNQFDDANYVSSAFRLAPISPALHSEDGTINWQIAEVDGANSNTWTNPLSYLMRTHDASTDNFIGSANFSYEIAPGLLVKANGGITHLNSDDLAKTPISSRSPTTIGATTKGISVFGSNKRKSWIVEPQISYSKELSNHKVEAVLGTTLQQSDYKMSIIRGMGYSSDALLNSIVGATTVTYNNDESQYRYTSLLGHIGYTYNEKYLVNISGRRDGSSRFGPGNRFGNFYSLSAGWIFSKENIITDNLQFLSFGKIRGSYGTTGSDQIGDYRFYDTYSIYPTLYQGSVSAYPDAIFNPNFAWEKTNKLEAGIELGAIDNRISLEVSWYRNRSSNQLVDYQAPLTTGFNSIFRNFGATVENTGWEVVLNTTNITTQRFKWSTSFNLTTPKNKLVEFPDIENSPYSLTYKVGQPLSIQYLYTYTGVNPETGEREFKDIDNNGAYDFRDQDLMKPLIRNYYGGIANTFTFGNIEFSFLLQFMKFYASEFYTGAMPGQLANQQTDVTKRWRKEGDLTRTGKYTQSQGNYSLFLSQFLSSDANTKQIEFLRLKTLSLSYRLPFETVERVKLRDARIYLQGQNLLTFSNDTRLDPETGYGLPPLRIVNIGVQFKL